MRPLLNDATIKYEMYNRHVNIPT